MSKNGQKGSILRILISIKGLLKFPQIGNLLNNLFNDLLKSKDNQLTHPHLRLRMTRKNNKTMLDKQRGRSRGVLQEHGKINKIRNKLTTLEGE